MSRQLIAIVVSSVLVIGHWSTSAMSAPIVRPRGQTGDVRTAASNNQSPLPPGTAAGIKQAQAWQIDPLLGVGMVVVVFLLGVLLLNENDGDDHGSVASTTGTNWNEDKTISPWPERDVKVYFAEELP
jgi:hypothetical protein